MTRSSAATLKLRRPRISDIPRLVEIERAAFAAGYYREHRLTAADFEMLLRRDKTFFLVAESRRLVVGDLVGDLPLSKAKRLARVDSIAVDPEWGACRIGSRLARRFLAHAHRLGYRGVTLEVAVPNRGAQRFFAGLGFRRLRRLAKYYSGRVDGLRMTYMFR